MKSSGPLDLLTALKFFSQFLVLPFLCKMSITSKLSRSHLLAFGVGIAVSRVKCVCNCQFETFWFEARRKQLMRKNRDLASLA